MFTECTTQMFVNKRVCECDIHWTYYSKQWYSVIRECVVLLANIHVVHSLKVSVASVNTVNSEFEPQGWVMNWLCNRLAVYQFMKSDYALCSQVWTNLFNKLILVIQSPKTALPITKTLQMTLETCKMCELKFIWKLDTVIMCLWIFKGQWHFYGNIIFLVRWWICHASKLYFYFLNFKNIHRLLRELYLGKWTPPTFIYCIVAIYWTPTTTTYCMNIKTGKQKRKKKTDVQPSKGALHTADQDIQALPVEYWVWL